MSFDDFVTGLNQSFNIFSSYWSGKGHVNKTSRLDRLNSKIDFQHFKRKRADAKRTRSYCLGSTSVGIMMKLSDI